MLSRQLARQRQLNDKGLCARCGREDKVPGKTVGVRCFKRIRLLAQKRRGHKPWKPGRMGRPVKYL